MLSDDPVYSREAIAGFFLYPVIVHQPVWMILPPCFWSQRRDCRHRHLRQRIGGRQKGLYLWRKRLDRNSADDGALAPIPLHLNGQRPQEIVCPYDYGFRGEVEEFHRLYKRRPHSQRDSFAGGYHPRHGAYRAGYGCDTLRGISRGMAEEGGGTAVTEDALSLKAMPRGLLEALQAHGYSLTPLAFAGADMAKRR